jgi:uncharacterized glyoxalase superfamily protein PhnB
MTQPSLSNAAITQGCYVILEDVDAHCARARAAGAVIVIEPEDQNYGGRLSCCRDPEGHIWSFGSHAPGQGSAIGALPQECYGR